MNEPQRVAALARMFAPASIAVIGASDDASRIGGRPVAYLREYFRGALYPVNPRRETVQGLRAFPNVDAIGAPVDLAIIALAATEVLSAAEECVRAGVGSLAVFSSGFAETGGEGADRQRELVAIARRAGIRMLGPNCLGYADLFHGSLATFAMLGDAGLRPGPSALVTQSGAVAAILFRAAQRFGIGMGAFVSTGNEADLSLAEVVGYFVEEPDVRLVLVFAEGVRDARLLANAAERARALDKPIVFLKAGRSEVGARGGMSHTASIVGSDPVFDAYIRELGIVRVDSMQDLLDAARAFRVDRRPRGSRVGIVTHSGGAGILMADAAADVGLEVPELPSKDRTALAALVPAFGATANPVDCTGQVVNDAAILGAVVRAVAASDAIDIVCVGALDGAPDPEGRIPLSLRSAQSSGRKPIVAWCGSPELARALTSDGLPTFEDPSRAIRAIASLVPRKIGRPEPYATRDPKSASAARAQLARLGSHPVLLEHEAKQLLAHYGIPVVREQLAQTPDEAIDAAKAIGYPVALKAASRDLVHKSDVGGVRLRLRGDAEVREAFSMITAAVLERAPSARLEGMLVQAMAMPGLELACGLKRDPVFGPIVAVGLGGSLIEIIGEVALCPAPLTLEQANRMLASVHNGRLVRLARGLTPDARDRVARILVALGDVAIDLEEVSEVDLNPLVVGEWGAFVVDALIVRA